MARARRLALLGSSGSLGQQALEIARFFPQELKVHGLGSRTASPLFLQQVEEFRPRWVAIAEPRGLPALQELQPRIPFKLVTLEELAASPETDLALICTVGRAGLLPTLAALEAGRTVLLANKEVLAMAGALVVEAARRGGGSLRPVDSEHVALWQCLQGHEKAVARLVLTASGGALRDWPLERLAAVTPEEALRHPTWRMGPKITVDSATLFNKGLELLEARWLFDVPLERVEAVLHRESIIHALVEFVDGSFTAQLSSPDMRSVLQYSLFYPERPAHSWGPPLDLARLGSLSFEPVDETRYPCLRLVREAGRQGGSAPAHLCAVDEEAVAAFLGRRIGFLDIPQLLEEALASHRPLADPSLEELLVVDEEARRWASQRIAEMAP